MDGVELGTTARATPRGAVAGPLARLRVTRSASPSQRMARLFLVAHVGLIAVSVAAFGLVMGQGRPDSVSPEVWNRAFGLGLRWTGPAYIVTGFGAALCGWLGALPARRALRGAGLVALLGLTAELLGTHTGFPFGPYSYGPLLGPKVLGLVPVTIPLSWVMMTYASLGIAVRLEAGRAATAVATALGLVAWDVLMDPAMSAVHPFWQWHVDGVFHGMPLVNWAGWLGTGIVMGAAVLAASGPAARRLGRSHLPVLLYAANGAFPLALVLQGRLYDVAILGGAAMGLFVAAPYLLPASRRAADGLAASLDRRIARPGFRRRTAGLPLAGSEARRRSRRLSELCSGFVASQVLQAALRLELPELLAAGPRTSGEIAMRLSLPEGSCRAFLDACEALRLVRRRGTAYGLGSLGAPLVDNPPLRAMLEHNQRLYDDLSDPVALLRDPDRAARLRRLWPYASAESPGELADLDVDDYSRLMDASADLVTEELLAAVDLNRHERLLDVGGGEGRWIERAAAEAPGLALELFDLPAVASRAERRLRAGGLDGRLTVHPGDFRRDPIPPGADLVTLVRIVQDQDDDAALALLRGVHAALPADGVLAVAEALAGDGGAGNWMTAYFRLYFLAMGSGRLRTREEMEVLLRRAGFRHVDHPTSRLPVQGSVLLARP